MGLNAFGFKQYLYFLTFFVKKIFKVAVRCWKMIPTLKNFFLRQDYHKKLKFKILDQLKMFKGVYKKS